MSDWKDVKGYDGRYQVNVVGQVKSVARTINNNGGLQDLDERILKQSIANTGYTCVNLSKNGRQCVYNVHRLVYEAFNGRVPNDVDIMHLDGDRGNPELLNLRIGSRSCNMAFTIDDGTAMLGEKNHRSVLTTAKVKRAREYYHVGISGREIAETLKVNYQTIMDAIKFRSWVHVEG